MTILETSCDPAALFRFVAEHPEYDSPAKRENYRRLEEARAEGRLVVEAAPSYIRFEPSAACNLRCCWAQRHPGHPALRPRGLASVDLARRVVDEFGETLYQAILCHWGEPTLNPKLPEMVRLFHSAGVYTTFDSNMMRVTPEVAEALVEAGLDGISASIDGISQASYGQYRIGGDVEKAIAGLQSIVDAKRRLGRSNPHVRWQFLVFPHNEHEVDAAERLADDIGVDWFHAFGGSGRPWQREQGFLPPDPPRRPKGLLCDDPWRYVAIDWDGGVQVCCRAFQAKHLAGHMDHEPLRAIFNNERFQLARRVIRDGAWQESDAPTPCTGCNLVKLHVPAIAALGHTLGLDVDK